MKILFLTVGPEMVASSRTRVCQYLPFLRKENIRYKIISYRSEFHIQWSFKQTAGLNYLLKKMVEVSGKFYRFLKFFQSILYVPFYDILFIQKIPLPIFMQRVLQRLNPKIVLDFDDSTFFLCNGPRGVNHILQISKLVIIENEYNAAYVRQFNENILYIVGPIDTDRYFPGPKRSNRDKIMIGWIGSPQHKDYLLLLKNVFKSLSKKYPKLSMCFIGANRLEIDGAEVITKKWSLNTEVANLQDLDIGIAPLRNDKTSLGKGGYKALQYMAVGIPSVVSPIGINIDLIQEGVNGFLASTEEEWIEKLSILIENEELRKRMGKIAREIAVEKYSFYTYAPKFINALKRIIESAE